MNEKIAVYGTGKIGSCEAVLASGNGFGTTVIGHTRAGLERCLKTMEQCWDDLIAEGLASEKNKAAAMALVTVTDDPSALEGCTFVFEAVAEDVGVKKEVYAAIEKNAPADAVIASCTSSINADILAGLASAPERVIIAHPFQPAHMLPLVEVVCHDKTAPSVRERTTELLNRLHRKVVVLNKSVPGFLVNRFANALTRESIYLIEQGVATAEDINTAVKYAVGMRYASIGLLEYFDDVGFDLQKAIASNIYPSLCSSAEIRPTVLRGIESGKKGMKEGCGLLDWSKIDADDYRRRKQAPFFDSVKEWDMPE